MSSKEIHQCSGCSRSCSTAKAHVDAATVSDSHERKEIPSDISSQARISVVASRDVRDDRFLQDLGRGDQGNDRIEINIQVGPYRS